jgi:hypothetical protein
MPLYVRIHPQGFREYLVVLRNEWEFPSIAMMDGVEANGYTAVDYTFTSTFTTTSMCMTEGLWITDGDFVPRGEIQESISGIINIFGIPISTDTIEKWKQVILQFQTYPSQFSTCRIPIVLYHGTSKSNFASILNTGLEESRGMLGQGVYLGSFWKACRFACRTHDYRRIDDPLVFRVIVLATSIQTQPSQRCRCSQCEEDQSLLPLYTDHYSYWRKRHDMIYLPSTKLKNKYIVKNAEWAVKKNTITIQQAVDIDSSSVDWENYNPFQRDIQFL